MSDNVTTALPEGVPLYLRIAETLRRRIAAGEFPPGTRLPSVRMLARENGVPSSTMGRTLQYLQADGILCNRPKVGVFVRGPSADFKRVGIYLSRTPDRPGMRFYAVLVAHMLRQFADDGVEARVFYDSRGEEENQAEPWPELLHAVRTGQVEALAVPLLNKRILSWCFKLGIPTVFRGDAQTPYGDAIGWNFEPLLELLLEDFRRHGVRSTGLIGTIPAVCNSFGTPLFPRQFLDFMTTHGIECPPELIHIPPNELLQKNFIGGGHRMGLDFLRSSRRPDALVVYPDITAEGVIAAVLESSGVATLGPTRLYLHCHPDLPIYLPVPCTVFGDPVAENARTMIASLRRAAAGLPRADSADYFVIQEHIPSGIDESESTPEN